MSFVRPINLGANSAVLPAVSTPPADMIQQYIPSLDPADTYVDESFWSRKTRDLCSGVSSTSWLGEELDLEEPVCVPSEGSETSRRRVFELMLRRLSVRADAEVTGFVGIFSTHNHTDYDLRGALDVLCDTKQKVLSKRLGWTQSTAVNVQRSVRAFREDLDWASHWMDRYEEVRAAAWRRGMDPNEHLLAQQMKMKIHQKFSSEDLRRLNGTWNELFVHMARKGDPRVTVPDIINAFITARLKHSWFSILTETYLDRIHGAQHELLYLENVLFNNQFYHYRWRYRSLYDLISSIDPKNPELSLAWPEDTHFISLEMDARGEQQRLKKVLKDQGWSVRRTRITFPSGSLLWNPHTPTITMRMRLLPHAKPQQAAERRGFISRLAAVFSG